MPLGYFGWVVVDSLHPLELGNVSNRVHYGGVALRSKQQVTTGKPKKRALKQ
jgi:hypothetical protein